LSARLLRGLTVALAASTTRCIAQEDALRRGTPDGPQAAQTKQIAERLAAVEEKIARIERRLDAIVKMLTSKPRQEARTGVGTPTPAARVLDKDTLVPIPRVRVLSPGRGYGRETDANGVFSDTKGWLRSGRRILLYHPDYEIQQEDDYKLDSTGMVTFLMRGSGDASQR